MKRRRSNGNGTSERRHPDGNGTSERRRSNGNGTSERRHPDGNGRASRSNNAKKFQVEIPQAYLDCSRNLCRQDDGVP